MSIGRGLGADFIQNFRKKGAFGRPHAPWRLSSEYLARLNQSHGRMASRTTTRITSSAFFCVSVVGRREDQTSLSWLMMRGE